MENRQIDFVSGLSSVGEEKKVQRFDLYSKYPNQLNNLNVNDILSNNRAKPRENLNNNIGTINDGLYVSTNGPLTYDTVKPYELSHRGTIEMHAIPKISKKLLEISIRDVKIYGLNSSDTIDITSISILYKEKIICKISPPFNHKLYKLLMNNTTESSNNLLIRVQTRVNCCSTLPLPLPTRCVKDKNYEMDFSINTSNGSMYSGKLIYTISLSIRDNSNQENTNNKNNLSMSLYKFTDDPNDPQNSLSLMRQRKIIDKKKINYFLLHDLALQLNTSDIEKLDINKKEKITSPNLVVLEYSRFSLWDFSFCNWLQAKRPLRSSSPTTHALKIHGGRDEMLTITILRGIEIPVREDSMTVQPLIQIKWGDTIHYTTPVDGPTAVWQQTIHFGIPKGEIESQVELSLFDQHPIWGLQWLGKAKIPLEFYGNYQEIECWIGLSSLYNPVYRFGYIPNNNSINSQTTRIYVLIKMKRLNNEEICEKNSLNTLSRSIQRCMITPYKINGINNSDDAVKLVMLLMPLPKRYGPLNPRQALKLNKVDYYGRAALLATLLQGLCINAYVVIGTSQTRKWAAFVLSLNGKSPLQINIWDPENGNDQYTLGDSKCSLIKISRLINHQNIWKNLQKVNIISNLKFNLKNGKDWQALGQTTGLSSSSSSSLLPPPQPPQSLSTVPLSSRDAQILDLDIPSETIDENTWMEIENDLKDKLSIWRSKMGFTTVFNRHAASILRTFLTKLSNPTDSESSSNRNMMKQLYRSYHTHGFILNLRYMPRDELIHLFSSTKIQDITGAIEFALVCNIQRYIGKTLSLWLAIAVLRSRD